MPQSVLCPPAPRRAVICVIYLCAGKRNRLAKRDKEGKHAPARGETAEGVEVGSRMEVDSVTAREGTCRVGLARSCPLQRDCLTPVKPGLLRRPRGAASF